MIDAKRIDELASQLAKLMPQQLAAASEDLGQNLRAVVQGWFDRLDLVTREEFEVQKAVLERTRAKLESLEEQLAGMEKDKQL